MIEGILQLNGKYWRPNQRSFSGVYHPAAAVVRGRPHTSSMDTNRTGGSTQESPVNAVEERESARQYAAEGEYHSSARLPEQRRRGAQRKGVLKRLDMPGRTRVMQESAERRAASCRTLTKAGSQAEG
jgi:hypothetical protein